MSATPINSVSVIVPVKNEGSNIKLTVDSLLQTRANCQLEVVVVDDASQDGCCQFLMEDEANWLSKGVKLIRTTGVGAANARNLGAENAQGDLMVFSDAHVVVDPDWLEKMMGTVVDPAIDLLTPGIADYSSTHCVGYGQTWDARLDAKWLPPCRDISPIPLAPGGFVAVKRHAFEKVGGFERGFKIWGYEDVEFSFKCWLFGFSIYVIPQVIVKHIFRPRHTYYISFNEVYYNLLRLAYSHFNDQRIAKTTEMIKKTYPIENILRQVFNSDIWQQRGDFFSRRVHDDDWFMQKFNIPY